MKRSWRRTGTLMLAWLMLCSALPVTHAEAGAWEWAVAPYLRASDVSVDVTANGHPLVPDDVAISDILARTDLAGMLHFEGATDRAGLWIDALYLSLSDDQTTGGRPPLIAGTQVSSALDMGIYEAGGFYRPVSGEQTLDILLGIRLIGIRYDLRFASRWPSGIRADVSGGDTELTWNVLPSLGLRIGKTDRYGARFGWRYLDVEMEQETDGVHVATDLVWSGPDAAFTFEF